MEITNQPRVLIVILNYNTFQLTLSLIKELGALQYAPFDIMVVDNCSRNESAQVLEEHAAEMGYLFYANKVNSGYAAGNNIGIRYGIEHGYAYSWILNNDVKLRDLNVLEHMVHIAQQHPEIGCVGPKIYSRDGSICSPYCRRPSLWDTTFGIFADKKYRVSQNDISQKVYRVYGCCMLLKNSTMAEIDCMDEATFLYGEELILAERMLAVNSVAYYDAEVAVTHNESSSMATMDAAQRNRVGKISEESREIYLKKYRHFGFFKRCLWQMAKRTLSYAKARVSYRNSVRKHFRGRINTNGK